MKAIIKKVTESLYSAVRKVLLYEAVTKSNTAKIFIDVKIKQVPLRIS